MRLDLDFPFCRIRLLPVKHDDMTNPLNEHAGSALRKLRRELLLLFLERVEFHFHEFMTVECLVDARKQGVGQSRLADMNNGFEPLTEPAQVGNLFRAQFAHARQRVMGD